MAGLFSYLTEPWNPYGGGPADVGGNSYGLTNADQIGLFGRALAGLGAGLNSGPRGLVNQGGVLTIAPSNNWGAGFAGMNDAYSQGMNDINRRMLTGSQLKTAELNRQKTQQEIDKEKRDQENQAELTAAIQSGDEMRIAAARAKFDPAAAYKQQYGWQKPAGQTAQEQAERKFATDEQIRANQAAWTADIKDYEYARQKGFKGTFEQWLNTKAAASGDFSKSPFYAQGPNGELAAFQLGSRGAPMPVQLPQGYKPADQYRPLDLGTGYTPFGSRTGATGSAGAPGASAPATEGAAPPAGTPGFIAKDIVGQERAQAVGKGQGAAEIDMPKMERSVKTIEDSLDEVMNHPGRKYAQGDLYGRVPPQLLAGDARAFANRLDQVKAQTYAVAFETLKGGGPISEYEGKSVNAGLQRLDRATNDKEFESAAKDLKTILRDMLEARKKTAGGKGGSDSSTAQGLSPADAALMNKWLPRGRSPGEASGAMVPVR